MANFSEQFILTFPTGEDDEMENEIDDNLDAIHRGAKTLNLLGRAMGEEIDSQNKHIDRISGKVSSSCCVYTGHAKHVLTICADDDRGRPNCHEQSTSGQDQIDSWTIHWAVMVAWSACIKHQDRAVSPHIDTIDAFRRA